jgi:DNA mismatch repair protein MutL
MIDHAPLGSDAPALPDEAGAEGSAAPHPFAPADPSALGGWSMPADGRPAERRPVGGGESVAFDGWSGARGPAATRSGEQSGARGVLSPREQSDMLFRPQPPASLPSLFSGETAAPASPSADVLVQLHGAYILASTRSGVVIVDQQAAHERILFERALASLQNGLALSQQMMPETYTFSAPDLALLKDLLPRLRALGFSIQIGGGRAAVVTGLPTDVSVGEARSLLEDVLGQYREEEEQDGEPVAPTVALARSIARRRALRRGSVLDPPRMRDLVDELFACDTPFAAPDGRPTLIQLTVGDLDRRFGRG